MVKMNGMNLADWEELALVYDESAATYERMAKVDPGNAARFLGYAENERRKATGIREQKA